MGVYLRGKIYWYKRMIEGACYYRSLKIHKGQKSMLSERIEQVDDAITAEHFGLPSPASSGSMTLGDFIKVYRRRKSGKGSLDRDIQRLTYALELMGDKRLVAYGRNDFQDLEIRLLKTRQRSTVNRYFQVLHHLFSLAVKDRALRTNPLDDHEYFIEDEKGGRALTDDEIKKLLDALCKFRDGAAPHEHIKHLLYDIVRFGLYTGARLSEIIFLRQDQIQNGTATLRLGETKFRKRGRRTSSREKMIYLSPGALEIIGRQPKSADGHIFAMPCRDPRVISKAVNTYRALWGVPEFTFHWLRHTFITWAVMIAEPVTVKALVGHADFRTTLRYTHINGEKKADIAAKLGTKLRSLDIKH